MSRPQKVTTVVAVLLLVPIVAYAVGLLAAPPPPPTPRPDIAITESPSRNTDPEDRQPGNDDVRVVTPRPAPVDDDDD